MTQTLPRVTYSNIGVDFTPVHDHLDTLIPDFEAQALGRTWQTPFATAPATATATSRIGAIAKSV